MKKEFPQKISVWWDEEGDFLEVTFDDGVGTMAKTEDGLGMVKVDEDGNIIGFALFGTNKRAKAHPFEFELKLSTSRD